MLALDVLRRVAVTESRRRLCIGSLRVPEIPAMLPAYRVDFFYVYDLQLKLTQFKSNQKKEKLHRVHYNMDQPGQVFF